MKHQLSDNLLILQKVKLNMLGGQLISQKSDLLHEKLIKIIVEDNNCKHEESLKRFKQLRREKILTFTQIGLKEKKEMAMIVIQSIDEMKKQKQENRYKLEIQQIMRQEEKRQREDSKQFKIKAYLNKIALEKEERQKEMAKQKVQDAINKQQIQSARKNVENNKPNKPQNNLFLNQPKKDEVRKQLKQGQNKNAASLSQQPKEKNKSGSLFSFNKPQGNSIFSSKIPLEGKGSEINSLFPLSQNAKPIPFATLSNPISPFGVLGKCNPPEPNKVPGDNTPPFGLFSGPAKNLFSGNTFNDKQQQPNFLLNSNSSNNLFAKKNQAKELNSNASMPLFSNTNTNTNSMFKTNNFPVQSPQTSLFGENKNERKYAENVLMRQQKKSEIDSGQSSPEIKSRLIPDNDAKLLFGHQKSSQNNLFGLFGAAKSTQSSEMVRNSINGSSSSSLFGPQSFLPK